MKTRPGPWFPLSFARWSRAKKTGFRRTQYPARLGWDDPTPKRMSRHLLSISKGMLAAISILFSGIVTVSGLVPVIVALLVVVSTLAFGEVVSQTTERYEVLYKTAPSWRVGEDDNDRDLTDPSRSLIASDNLYPEDYSGKVLAVKQSPASWRPGDLASPDRQIVGLDLTRAQVSSLHVGQQKIDPSTQTLSMVTVDDKYGATLPGLVSKLGSLSAVEAVDTDVLTGAVAPDSEEAVAFLTEFSKLRRALAKTVVHTGAGLYEVGPGKTYSTIQSALDQLWSDQGSAVFTANQYIRIFADTYSELPRPNASLNPDEVLGKALIIEGDPNDDRSNIVIQPPSNGDCIRFDGSDIAIVRHLKISGGAGEVNGVYGGSALYTLLVEDCVIDVARTPAYALNSIVVKDCVLTTPGNPFAGVTGAVIVGSLLVERCEIISSGGKAASNRAGVEQTKMGATVRGCTIRGFARAFETRPNTGSNAPNPVFDFRNNTIYSCGSGVYFYTANDTHVYMINNIFKDCDQNFLVPTGGWPEETASLLGPYVVQRNNCFHGYTNFAYDGSTAKTFAQWNAYNRVDNDGDLDTDPLLTNPGSGDFSLQSGSPCRHAGHGSGVLYDYLGTPFDKYTPDIGAWSSGPAPGGGGQQTRYLLEEA